MVESNNNHHLFSNLPGKHSSKIIEKRPPSKSSIRYYLHIYIHTHICPFWWHLLIYQEKLVISAHTSSLLLCWSSVEDDHLQKTSFFTCFGPKRPRLQTHDVGLFPFVLQLVRHFGGLGNKQFPPRPEPVGSPYKKRPCTCWTRVLLPRKSGGMGPYLQPGFLGPLWRICSQNQSPESSSTRNWENERNTLGFHDGFGFRSMLIEFQLFYDSGGGRKDFFDLGYFI